MVRGIYHVAVQSMAGNYIKSPRAVLEVLCSGWIVIDRFG